MHDLLCLLSDADASLANEDGYHLGSGFDLRVVLVLVIERASKHVTRLGLPDPRDAAAGLQK